MHLRFFSLFLAGTLVLTGQQWITNEEEHHAEDRQRWFYDQRTYPTGSIPAGARRNAFQQLQRTDAAVRAQHQNAHGVTSANQAFSITTDSANWTMIGPRPTNKGNSATSGRVTAIAIDPRDNNVVYIGGAEGGIWKTTDGGATWTPLTDNQASLATGAIALDPGNPDTVYVGTGEENFAQDSYYGAGILKSTDGGATWTNIVGPFLRDYIGAIAVSPTNSNLVFAAAQSGLWRSTDGGQSWTSVLLNVPAISIIFDPADPTSVWTTLGNIFGSSRNGLYHSTDSGQTWRAVTGGGFPSVNVGRTELAISPSAPGTMYVQIQNSISTSTGLLGIYKTTDSGATWTRSNLSTSQWGTQVWFTNTIRVSPTDPNVIWSGALGVYRSLDGGTTWASVAQLAPNGVSIHVDFHALIFTPDGSRLWLANDGGIYSTTDVSSSRVNWNNHNDTLAVTEFYPGMALDPTDPRISLGGVQDNGSQRLAVDGSWTNVACGDGAYAIIDPSFPAQAYAGCQKILLGRGVPALGSNVFVTADYGIDQNDPVQFIPPFVLDPANPQTLYFGTFRLWRTTDSGGQWTPVSGDLSGGNRGTIKTIAVAPSAANTIYAGTSNGKVQVTREAAKGLSAVWTDRTVNLPPRTVTKIAVDPLDPATAYITFSGFASSSGVQGYVFKTTDAGATWTNITGNLPIVPVNDIAIDPDLPDTLYIATDLGVELTTDGGATWATLGNGMPNVVVHALALHRPARILRAATHGRSVWEIAIPIARPSLQPVIDSVSPTAVSSGGAGFTLSVTGSRFVAGTVIRWNGADRPTKFVDSTHLQAQIAPDDIATAARVSLTAFTASTGAGSSVPKGFVVGAPRSTPAGFVSAADPTGGSALAPRSIASLYGVDMASGVVVAGGAPLPSSMGGTVVTVGGIVAPLFFVSPGQINFHVPLPSGVNGPTTVPLTIIQGLQTTTINITLKPYAPSLFTSNAQGSGQASTVIAGTASLAAPSSAFPGARPAKGGDFLSIYCTGLGDVNNRPALGSASPGSPLATTLATPSVKIGGADAQVIFSGLAPGFVGLYQVNVKVPDGITPGDAVPLVLTIGGVASNTATIAVVE